MKTLLAIVFVALSTSFGMAQATQGANCASCCKDKVCHECCGDDCASCEGCK